MTREGRDEREKSSSLKKNVFFFFFFGARRRVMPIPGDDISVTK